MVQCEHRRRVISHRRRSEEHGPVGSGLVVITKGGYDMYPVHVIICYVVG